MLAWILLALGVLLGVYIVAGGADASGAEVSAPVVLTVALSCVLSVALAVLWQRGGATRYWVKRALVPLALLGAAGLYLSRDRLVLSPAVPWEAAGHSAPAVEAPQPGEVSVRLRRDPEGHFKARVTIEGATFGAVVDTGAATVVLRPADAEKAGVDVAGLDYSVALGTANGTAYAAPVRLKSIAIGTIVVRDVEALVARPGSLKESLLGMSFLKRLRSYEVSGEYLTLRG